MWSIMKQGCEEHPFERALNRLWQAEQLSMYPLMCSFFSRIKILFFSDIQRATGCFGLIKCELSLMSTLLCKLYFLLSVCVPFLSKSVIITTLGAKEGAKRIP